MAWRGKRGLAVVIRFKVCMFRVFWFLRSAWRVSLIASALNSFNVDDFASTFCSRVVSLSSLEVCV